MGGELASQACRGGIDVAVDDDVELAGCALEQQVADRAADEADAVAGREGAQQQRAAGVGAQRLQCL